MSNPTMVSIVSGPHSDGYTFCIIGNEKERFTCKYDGKKVKLSIYIHGTRVSETLEMVKGLLHSASNFKKKLYQQYSEMKLKRLESIFFVSTTGYKFTVKKDSNIDELMKEYYRSYRYEVHDDDDEDSIVAREHEKMKKELMSEDVEEEFNLAQ